MPTAHQHVCARCAKTQAACCILNKGEEKICFPLFSEEIERISSHVGHDNWLAIEPNHPDFIQVMKRMMPSHMAEVDEHFPLNGRHYRLGTSVDGRCLLLGEHGCVLPRNVRPYHCRLFPFWMNGGRIVVLEAKCLARQEATNLEELLHSVDTDKQEVRDLFASLQKAWSLPGF